LSLTSSGRFCKKWGDEWMKISSYSGYCHLCGWNEPKNSTHLAFRPLENLKFGGNKNYRFFKTNSVNGGEWWKILRKHKDSDLTHMDVSKNSGFSPQIIHFSRVFPLFSPSILGFFPIFGNTRMIHMIRLFQCPGEEFMHQARWF